MKKITTYLALCAAALLFAACSDLIDTPSSETAKSAQYTIRGSIAVGGTSGALPSAFVAASPAETVLALDKARSVTTSFTKTTKTLGELTITATQDDLSVQGTVTTTEDGTKTYTLVLPETGEWTIAAYQKIYKDDAETDTVSLLEYHSSKWVPDDTNESWDILLYPVEVEDVSGAVDLSLTVPDGITSVSYVSAEKDSDGNPIINSSSGVTDHEATITLQKIPAGYYNVTFAFHKADGDAGVYTCTEAVTIFSGFVTDTWYGASPYMQKDADGNYAFVLTDHVIVSYATAEKTLSPSDYPIILWNNDTAKSEISVVSSAGYGIFTEISGGETLSDGIALANTKVTDFEIDPVTQAIYTVESGFAVKKYPSYAGFTYGKTLANRTGESILDFAVYDGEVYVAQNTTSQTIVISKLVDDRFVDFAVHDASGADFSLPDGLLITADKNYLYTAALTWDTSMSGENRALVFAQYAIDTTAQTLSQVATLSLSLGDDSATGLGIYTAGSNANPTPNFKITDLQLNTDTNDTPALYVLVSDIGNESDRFYAHGGLIKIGISEQATTATGIPQHTLGLDSIDDVPLYGWYADDINAAQAAASDTATTAGTTGANTAEKYFFGAQKFIAAKPGKLVIADEGVWAENGEGFNRNRVVTVDLADLGKNTFVDVQVSFSVYADVSTSYSYVGIY